jgi:hypothetical protein
MTIEFVGSATAVRQPSAELEPLRGVVNLPFANGAMAVVSAIVRNTQTLVSFDTVAFNGLGGHKAISGTFENGLDHAEIGLWLIPADQLGEGEYHVKVSAQGDPGTMLAFAVHVYSGVTQSTTQGQVGVSSGIGGRAHLALSKKSTEVIVDAFGGLADELALPGEGYTLLDRTSSSLTDNGFISAAQWDPGRQAVTREGGTTSHWIMCGVALQQGPLVNPGL